MNEGQVHVTLDVDPEDGPRKLLLWALDEAQRRVIRLTDGIAMYERKLAAGRADLPKAQALCKKYEDALKGLTD